MAPAPGPKNAIDLLSGDQNGWKSDSGAEMRRWGISDASDTPKISDPEPS
jgi:hypothetical protein